MHRAFLVLLLVACSPSGHPDWPQWASQRVGFWDADAPDRFHVVDVATGRDVEVKALAPFDPARWTFAAGDEIVVVQTAPDRIESFAAATGESQGVLATSGCGHAHALTADPLGDMVALAVKSDDCGATTLQVHRFDDGWSARAVFATAGDISEIAWAPAAHVLAIIRRPDATRWVLTRVDVDTGDLDDLFVSTEAIALPRLAPDGYASWAVAARDVVHMPGWHEMLDDDVVALAWHPTRDDLIAFDRDNTSRLLHPVAQLSEFGTFHADETLVVGWANGDEEPFLKPCGVAGLVPSIDADQDSCIDGITSAAWSGQQDLLLLADGEVLLVDANADTLRSLGPGVAPRWARSGR